MVLKKQDSEKKILHLTLLRNWFDLIVSGDKIVENRCVKPYWTKRLEGKQFDEIYFKNGYAKDAPFMRVEWNGISKKVNPDTGEEKYVISLGKVLEVKNI